MIWEMMAVSPLPTARNALLKCPFFLVLRGGAAENEPSDICKSPTHHRDRNRRSRLHRATLLAAKSAAHRSSCSIVAQHHQHDMAAVHRDRDLDIHFSRRILGRKGTAGEVLSCTSL